VRARAVCWAVDALDRADVQVEVEVEPRCSTGGSRWGATAASRGSQPTNGHGKRVGPTRSFVLHVVWYSTLIFSSSLLLTGVAFERQHKARAAHQCVLSVRVNRAGLNVQTPILRHRPIADRSNQIDIQLGKLISDCLPYRPLARWVSVRVAYHYPR
jgi:hypothetical protein